MQKLKMHTPNLVAENIEKLTALFPNCVTEAKDDTGQLKRVIDFDQLRQELSDHIVEGPRERYRECTRVFPRSVRSIDLGPKAVWLRRPAVERVAGGAIYPAGSPAERGRPPGPVSRGVRAKSEWLP